MNSNGGVVIPKWAIAIVPLVAGLFGVGLAWGVMGADIEYNSERIKHNTQAISKVAPDLRSIDTRLARIEGALNIQSASLKPKLGIR